MSLACFWYSSIVHSTTYLLLSILVITQRCMSSGSPLVRFKQQLWLELLLDRSYLLWMLVVAWLWTVCKMQKVQHWSCLQKATLVGIRYTFTSCCIPVRMQVTLNCACHWIYIPFCVCGPVSLCTTNAWLTGPSLCFDVCLRFQLFHFVEITLRFCFHHQDL